MTDQETIPIVETEVYTRMEWAIRNVLDTAGRSRILSRGCGTKA